MAGRQLPQFEVDIRTISNVLATAPGALGREQGALALERIVAVLKKIGPDFHTLDVRGYPDSHTNDVDDGWSIQHPLSCRPDLLSCPVHAAMLEHNWANTSPGRYRLHEGVFRTDKLLVWDKLEEETDGG